MLGRLGQAGVDRLGPCGTAGHGADQEGRLEPPPQEVDAQVDAGVVEIRQGLVHEAPVVEPRGQGVPPAPAQHHVQVLVLAAEDQGLGGGGVGSVAQGWRSTIST
ncbi:hypothetical protein D9M72_574470 [compost metagenome]